MEDGGQRFVTSYLPLQVASASIHPTPYMSSPTIEETSTGRNGSDILHRSRLRGRLDAARTDRKSGLHSRTQSLYLLYPIQTHPEKLSQFPCNHAPRAPNIQPSIRNSAPPYPKGPFMYVDHIDSKPSHSPLSLPISISSFQKTLPTANPEHVPYPNLNPRFQDNPFQDIPTRTKRENGHFHSPNHPPSNDLPSNQPTPHTLHPSLPPVTSTPARAGAPAPAKPKPKPQPQPRQPPAHTRTRTRPRAERSTPTPPALNSHLFPVPLSLSLNAPLLATQPADRTSLPADCSAVVCVIGWEAGYEEKWVGG